MHHSRPILRAVAVAAALALSGAAGVAGHAAWAHAGSGARQAGCPAVGTYLVGPRVVPLGVRRTPRTVAPGSSVPGSRRTGAVVWYPSVLRGTLDLTAYSGCGGTTAGSFAVQSFPVGPLRASPPMQGRRATTVPCWEPCWVPTGAISATGTFGSDPAHGGDAMYVTVGGTVITARPGPQMGRPCSAQYGCPPPVVITSTVTFNNVTGYLQVTADGQNATLSFLPPPAANSPLLAPAALVLVGHRGAQQVPPPGTPLAVTAVAGTAVAAPGTVVPEPSR